MKPELIVQLNALSDEWPFRPFELETLEGRRIQIMRRPKRLYGEGGDLLTERLEFLSYAELKDVVHILPPWKRPWSWLYQHPEVIALVVTAIFLLMIVTSSTFFWSTPTFVWSAPKTPQPLVTTTETVNGNTLTTIRSGDEVTRIIKTPEGQSFLEEGYINSWGEYHVRAVAGGVR